MWAYPDKLIPVDELVNFCATIYKQIQIPPRHIGECLGLLSGIDYAYNF